MPLNMTVDEAREALRNFSLNSDTPTAWAADIVLDEVLKLRSDLRAVLELATYFQADYERKLPVIAAFRHWRHGVLTAEEFLQRLRRDDLGEVLRYEPVAPMRGLTILNDRNDRKG